MKRLVLVLMFVLGAFALCAADEPRRQDAPSVLVIEIAGPIGPATARFVEQAIEKADAAEAEALIVRLDTPGGLSDSMRSVIRAILKSQTPIVTYVAPAGSRAASAGTYVLYASHVAAMSPGTNVGAATPVRIGGGLPGPPRSEDEARDGPDEDGGEEETDGGVPPPRAGSAATDKAVNDAIAYIRSLADLHGRNADWAERAVRSGESLPARDALDLGVIDLIATDLDALLLAIDGRVVNTTAGARTISSADARIDSIEPSAVTQALAVLSNPNVAFILMLIGVYGILFEFYNPGSVGPGVIGAVCLVLGLYALNQLPLSYAGAALILLGLAFMVAEALDPSFGILGLGGVVSFVIGAVLLVDTDIPEYRISWWTIGATAAVTGGFFFWLVGSLIASRSRPLTAGVESMIDSPATVIDWSTGRGHVHVQGERWRARGDGAFAPGQKVDVIDVRDLEVIVAPSEPTASKTET